MATELQWTLVALALLLAVPVVSRVRHFSARAEAWSQFGHPGGFLRYDLYFISEERFDVFGVVWRMVTIGNTLNCEERLFIAPDHPNYRTQFLPGDEIVFIVSDRCLRQTNRPKSIDYARIVCITHASGVSNIL